jgi:hypothetical protein
VAEKLSSTLPADSSCPADDRWSRAHIAAEFGDKPASDTPSLNDLLKESLRIVRGQTMMLPTKRHLEAMNANRNEMLLTLKDTASLLEAFVTEIEISFGTLPGTRKRLADLKMRIEVEEAA